MATAKEQAQKDLGDIRDYVNYSGYQKDIENARATYDTEIQSIQDKYNRLVDTINANRRQLGNDFTSGRSTVANEYYANRNLNTGAQLSSYLRGTGVNAANKTLNRMNLGNEFSKLANTYYHGQDELDTNLYIMKVHIRLSYKYKYISMQNYQSWSNLITNICNMLGGWINSCQKR